MENKNVATKKEVKSRKRAFWAAELSSYKAKPNSAAALTGVNTQLSTKPKIK